MKTQQDKVPNVSAKRAYEYFEEVKQEFLKVQWTEGAELKSYTKAVVGATFAFGMAIYIVDLLVHRVLLGFDHIFRFLFG